MSEYNDVPNMQAELDHVNAMIEKHTAQLEVVNGELQAIENEIQSDELSRQVLDIQAVSERVPSCIPAEEALDTITRLKNGLKVVKRRNQLLARENAMQLRLLNERSKLLTKETKYFEDLRTVTGWNEQRVMDHDDIKQKKCDVEEMSHLEVVVQKELQAAQSIIKKKEAIIRDLEIQLEKGKETDAVLNTIYNDIRVKERDCHQVEAQLQEMQIRNAKNEEALTVFTSAPKNVSIVYMETDINYIKEAVAEMKAVCRRQDAILKAQITRQQQLQARFDTIFKSLREMKLEKEYERNVLKSAIVPSASREEPEDVSKVLPEEEYIPINIYRLIYKNNEIMHTSVVRKNVLVLEKEGVIQALEANLLNYGNTLIMTTKQREDLKLNKDLEMGELIDELRKQHQNFLQQLEQLSLENSQLKKKLYQPQHQATRLKNRQVV